METRTPKITSSDFNFSQINNHTSRHPLNPGCMNYTRRIGFLIRRSFSLPRKLPALTAAISSSTNPKKPPPDPGSQAYQRAVRTQRPPAIRWDPALRNSISFIGTIKRPLAVINTKTAGRFGVYTVLQGRNPNGARDRPLEILVVLWENTARRYMDHIKQDDCVYVSGRLESYTRAGQAGVPRLHYKIIMKELCYVAQSGQVVTGLKPGDTQMKPPSTFQESQAIGGSGANITENVKDRLDLWRIVFAEPDEWWDNRADKARMQKDKCPDFKHKRTRVCLWLLPNDPAWIRGQLQLLDSKTTGRIHMKYDGEDCRGLNNNKLHMWQVFFANPHEWWDQRERKRNPLAPDFKHKCTGEALWLDANDPPWVKRQLQLIDSLSQNDNANARLSQFMEYD